MIPVAANSSLYEQIGPRAVRCWRRLEPIVERHRHRSGPGAWDDDERVAARDPGSRGR